jgi:ornithine carbamoyltransferase
MPEIFTPLIEESKMEKRLEGLKGRSVIEIGDLKPSEVRALLQRTYQDSKQTRVPKFVLQNATYSLMFYENSSRTINAFRASIAALGGQFNDINVKSSQIARGESIRDTCDFALNHMTRGLAIRVSDHSLIKEYSEYATIPMINALSNREHPTQTLADLSTIHRISGELKGQKVAYSGEFNNTARSLLLGCLAQGISVSIACPDINQVDELTRIKAEKLAEKNNCVFEVTESANKAVEGARFVYTDTITSMGTNLDEDAKQAKIKFYNPYQVNEKLMSLADPEAVAMHCGPAYPGIEISRETYEKNRNIIKIQADRRFDTLQTLLEFTCQKK